MSQSNVIDLRKWFETRSPSSGNQPGNFSNSRECIELLHAFTRIANPAFRFAIIRAAKEAFLTPQAGRRKSQHRLPRSRHKKMSPNCRIGWGSFPLRRTRDKTLVRSTIRLAN